MGEQTHGRSAPVFSLFIDCLSLAPAQADRRTAIEAEVERLLALLDALDGDPDFEPDDDGETDGGEELFWQENLRGGGK